jgi:hypothetical protein
LRFLSLLPEVFPHAQHKEKEKQRRSKEKTHSVLRKGQDRLCIVVSRLNKNAVSGILTSESKAFETMGFTIEQKIDCTRFGIQCSGCYVTIKCSLQVSKGNSMPMMMQQQQKPYVISARYYIYSAQNYSEIQPLFDDQFVCSFDEPPTNPVAQLYAELKSTKFAGLTLTDC